MESIMITGLLRVLKAAKYLLILQSTWKRNPSIRRIKPKVSLKKINQVEANRYNLSSNPADFTKNEAVLKELQEKGNDVLPITLVNDTIVKTGSYPTNEEIQEFTGIVFVTQNSQNNSCCGGNGTC